MNIHPIIFNTQMVRAILAGVKTMTRRPVTFPPDLNQAYDEKLAYQAKYRPGDLLWVRETYCRAFDRERGRLSFLYRADIDEPDIRWTPSIHMPRDVCRLFLEVIDIGCSRLRILGKNDVEAEGFRDYEEFALAWMSMYTKPGLRWVDNPWVIWLKFRIRDNKNQ